MAKFIVGGSKVIRFELEIEADGAESAMEAFEASEPDQVDPDDIEIIAEYCLDEEGEMVHEPSDDSWGV